MVRPRLRQRPRLRPGIEIIKETARPVRRRRDDDPARISELRQTRAQRPPHLIRRLRPIRLRIEERRLIHHKAGDRPTTTTTTRTRERGERRPVSEPNLILRRRRHHPRQRRRRLHDTPCCSDQQPGLPQIRSDSRRITTLTRPHHRPKIRTQQTVMEHHQRRHERLARPATQAQRMDTRPCIDRLQDRSLSRPQLNTEHLGVIARRQQPDPHLPHTHDDNPRSACHKSTSARGPRSSTGSL